MKTPVHPFTIHVIEANYMVKHIAAPRPSIWVRARPYLAHGLVQSGRVARFVVAALFHMIARVSIGLVKGIRSINFVSIRLFEFVFITVPLFLMGLFFLLATPAWAWGLVEVLSRGLSHLPRP